MTYIPIQEAAARQLIDATTIFYECVRVRSEARHYSGGMYWKRQGAYEYLIKTAGKRQKVLGPRNAATEGIFTQFSQRKAALQARLASLEQELTKAERLNKAVRVGRVPSLAVAVLQAFEDAGLGEHFVVVGTHALYAYETAAGVRIAPEALATQDVDLLWDARKRVQFLADLQRLGASVLQILQRVDKSFERKEPRGETAINDKGFEVDFIRPMQEGDDPHPFRFSNDEADLWPIQAPRASVLTRAPRFNQVVVAVTGRMALMRTISPRSFVTFKRWMGAAVPDREPIKRQRDLRQAAIVADLLEQGLLHDEHKVT